MLQLNTIFILTIVAFIVLLAQQISETNAAPCQGTIIFHWRETGDKRKSDRKNWTTQKTEMYGNASKLSVFIKPETTYGFTINNIKGKCCWEVYPENGYKGTPVELKSKLPNGFGGIKGHPKFEANSLKKIPCKDKK